MPNVLGPDIIYCKYGCGNPRVHGRGSCRACRNKYEIRSTLEKRIRADSATKENKLRHVRCGKCHRGCKRPLFSKVYCKYHLLLDSLKNFGIDPNTRNSIDYLDRICEDGVLCSYCGQRTFFELGFSGLTPDHIVPKSRGGLGTMDNLAWCCWKCQKAKSNMSILEFKEHIINMYNYMILNDNWSFTRS